jgi:hypothetical protein
MKKNSPSLNPLGHTRDMDIVAQKRGEAAVVWFRRILAAPVGPSLDSDQELSTKSAIKRIDQELVDQAQT